MRKYINLLLNTLFDLSRIAIILTFTIALGNAYGQNYPLYNGYITNPYLVNPAEAASNYFNIFANYRNQWAGLPGAPTIATVGFNTLLNDTRVGIGFKGSSFKRGFLNSSEAAFTYAYGVPIDKQNKLFFGLSGGILSNSVDWNMVSDLADPGDPALNNLKGGIMPSLSFGAMLKNASGINVGIVLPQMIKTVTLDNNFAIAPQDNLMLVAYYSNWHEQKKVSSHNKSKKTHRSSKNRGSPLEVFSIVRYSKNGTQVEASAKFNFQSHLWVSGTYRKVSGLIPGIGFRLGNLSAGYFYESGIAGDIPLKSHEVSLGFRLGEERKFKGESKAPKTPVPTTRPRFGDPDISEPKISKQTPKTKTKSNTVVAKNDPSKDPPVKSDPVVSNPITTEVKNDPVVTNPTTTEVKKDPVITNPTTTEIKKDPVETNPTTTEVKKDPDVTNTEVKKDPTIVTPEIETKKDPVQTDHQPRLGRGNEQLDPISPEDKVQHEEEQDKIARLSEHKDNPTEEHNEDGHPHAERHEFVRRGDHQSEMDLGDYVIVGVFRGEANAKHMSDELRKLGFSEVDFGFLTEKAVWYVHIAGSNDIEEARAKRNKYRKMKMFKDAWLLTVHQ
jgi:type IX secretion system PorP/SprF family membrane protein